MAPEDILRNIDEGRRDFIRKMVAGTTFAVPLIASFSMDGLSVTPAEALVSNTTCANTGPGSPCCELAQEISVIIGLVICLTGIIGHEIGASPQIKARLFRPLASALDYMSTGIESGGEGCDSRIASRRFQRAEEELEKYFRVLESVCGVQLYSELSEGIPWLFEALDSLIDGECELGFTALQNLQPIQQQLQQQFSPQP